MPMNTVVISDQFTPFLVTKLKIIISTKTIPLLAQEGEDIDLEVHPAFDA